MNVAKLNFPTFLTSLIKLCHTFKKQKVKYCKATFKNELEAMPFKKKRRRILNLLPLCKVETYFNLYFNLS
jgi:hypothetical protein